LVASHAQTLDDLAQLVQDVGEWTRAAIEAAFDAYLQKKGLQIKDVAQPARVALTGRSVSPGMYETIDVLGRDLSVSRLRAGAQRARQGAQVATP
jgi:glutamyl-tRNA synthetase